MYIDDKIVGVLKVRNGCSTCGFNFGGICAGCSDIYGQKIPSMPDNCPEWEMNISVFSMLYGRFDKDNGLYEYRKE